MSLSIENSVVVGFSSAVHVLAEQQGSKLRGLVTVEAAPVGTAYDKQITQNTFVTAPRVDRFEPTVAQDGTHTRRWVFMKTTDVAVRFDPAIDSPRILSDPRSRYVSMIVNKLSHDIDDEIIAAADRAVPTGQWHTAGTTSAFPTENVIAASGAGLTTAKLISAREKIEVSEVSDFSPRYCLISPYELTDLLGITEIKSADYNVVRALVQGEVNTWMGFEFRKSNRLTNDGAGARKCYAFTPEAIHLGIWRAPEVQIARDPTHKFTWLAYADQSFGAMRLDDNYIYQILCA